MTPALSVVIPAYNEEHRLAATLADVVTWLKGHEPSAEILVVDDGSSDRTVEIARGLADQWPALKVLEQQHNQGKGAALRRGCLEAAGRHVMFMDADNATRIEEIEKFLPLLSEGYGMVVGVRTYQQGESRARRIIGLGFLMFAHLFVFRRAVVDSQCARAGSSGSIRLNPGGQPRGYLMRCAAIHPAFGEGPFSTITRFEVARHHEVGSFLSCTHTGLINAAHSISRPKPSPLEVSVTEVRHAIEFGPLHDYTSGNAGVEELLSASGEPINRQSAQLAHLNVPLKNDSAALTPVTFVLS